MDDEILFTCELCGKSFPADPSTMLECSADFRAVNTETGDVVEMDSELRETILEEAQKDPQLSPFLKGAICICLECQENFAQSDDLETL